MSQAFDRVWHRGLILKTKKIFPSQIQKIISCFLSDRAFRVRVGQEHSSTGLINSGVPQGSVLAPLLYIIHTSDMPCIANGITATYADDTAFLISDKDKNTASLSLQTHLHNFSNWCRKWNIRINTEKSQHITFTYNKGNCPPININGQTIHESPPPRGEPPSVKYLGLRIDRRLTFAPHIKYLRKELNLTRKKLYFLLNSRSKLTLENKLTLYRSILKSKWLYCCPLWGLASNSNIEVIQRFQNITLRVCTGDLTYVPNADLMRDLKIPSVREEITRLAMKHRHKMAGHLNPLATEVIESGIVSSRLTKKQFSSL